MMRGVIRAALICMVSVLTLGESGKNPPVFEIADVHVGVSLGMTALFLVLCLGAVWWIFRTGFRLKT